MVCLKRSKTEETTSSPVKAVPLPPSRLPKHVDEKGIVNSEVLEEEIEGSEPVKTAAMSPALDLDKETQSPSPQTRSTRTE